MLPAVDTDNPVVIMQTGEVDREPEELPPPTGGSAMTVTADLAPPPTPHVPETPAHLALADFKLKSDTDCSELDADPDAPDLIQKEPSRLPDYHLEKNQLKAELGRFHEQNPNESVRSWLQRITAMQHEIQRKQKQAQAMGSASSANVQPGSESCQQKGSPASFASSVNTPPPRVVKYQDLPYMGEMTLDNSKPRRGRKPKKADICHLIYKNYGTIFPGTPKSLVDQEPIKRNSKAQKESPIKRTNVQNRIISSLLEKRLTQESQKNKELLSPNLNKISADQEEPLNLCIRDLNQLKIRLLRKHGNVYASDSMLSDVKSEPVSDDDVEFVDETPSPVSSVKIPESSPDIDSPFVENVKGDLNAPAGGYVYWPHAGVFIHPSAFHSQLLYYQKLAANGIPCPEAPESPPHSQELRKLVPKQVSRLQEKNAEEDASVESRLKRVAAQSASAPVKRKRSAIFIPPIPSENQTNPATEVSICKFKFTGGAKPSLQEKKMLSVDSGGNFRYYSGTGDKSMRGYEFFPRETLQQAGSSNGSSTGAFLQASGEKIPAAAETVKHKDFLFSSSVDASLPPLPGAQPSPDAADRRHRKRKTRKSLQREKLEQTFKEKGFLIQTQQLESAEGNVRELHETEAADKSDDEDDERAHLMGAHINASVV